MVTGPVGGFLGSDDPGKKAPFCEHLVLGETGGSELQSEQRRKIEVLGKTKPTWKQGQFLHPVYDKR